ncbi:sulfotransferase family 2 domain-containing protein [Phototrophicus methaneseepsis]|uniref:Sulfotransferase family 2 domain-containing protein n=1 Tax=Phototrophicus methaneseepsis TaxID=2710758 RepID=A0A7S8ICN1_9CHLR|nr:sulfotransferase family 2 domain-containing protein [Phototrophicus methaneseepsis]QPC80656.1 sulfotransferase family 2 domain-containing protein [Phototrophicus methaneseepsis]
MASETLRHDWQDNDVLIFTHIPKTAGTSLAAMLDRQFLPEERLELRYFQHPHLFDEIQAESEHRLISTDEYKQAVKTGEDVDNKFGAYKFIRGHTPYYPPPFKTHRAVYVTILRDPKKRAYSDYKHIATYNDNPKHEVVKAMSYEEFLMEDDLQKDTRNPLTSFILNKSPKTEADFEQACRNLESMAWFGIVEHFDASMLLLHYVFSWPYNFESWHLNRARMQSPQPELSAKALKRLEALNHYDIKLYNYAVNLFHQRVQHMATELFAENKDLSEASLQLEAEMQVLSSEVQALKVQTEDLQGALQAKEQELQRTIERYSGMKGALRALYQAAIPLSARQRLYAIRDRNR